MADLERLWEQDTWVYCEAAVCYMLPGLVGVSGEHSPPCSVQLPWRPRPSWVLLEVLAGGVACSVFLAWALTAFQLQSWNTLTRNTVTFGTIQPPLPLPCSCRAEGALLPCMGSCQLGEQVSLRSRD